MKLLIAGLLAICAGVVLAANQSSEDVPTGSLLVLNTTQPVATATWRRESPPRTPERALSPTLVSTAAVPPTDSGI